MTTLTRRALIAATGAAALVAGTAPLLAAAPPTLSVVKSPTCGCCTGWAEMARAAGYAVETRDVDDITQAKLDAGVPDDLWSCHTATLTAPDGRAYVIEGHVSFEAMDRLLTEAPDVAGLAAPGMPMGSPGMGYDPAAEYDMFAFGGAAGDGTIFETAGTR
ncbi:CopG family transcriptional regulator [Jannaschia sp. S6380]|uniref:DUF411 domain-containing protein n=1 Tax=Jannaschia sp. S6380 TaxID=2926408 RepID=UPI001FF12C4A|nr:DUF411 domain-containing protein [Jannaschia sp. S6380]MCK0166194.1 CopG family transcriptional regulator [Jannaschia sp. S6380]